MVNHSVLATLTDRGQESSKPSADPLLFSTADAQGALLAIEHLEPSRVRVAVHVRRGDFQTAPTSPGRFNTSVSTDWYVSAVMGIVRSLDRNVQVFIVSDSVEDELDQRLLEQGVPSTRLAHGVMGDLATLAHSDITVSSVSSFSMLANFLSSSFYVWHRQNLNNNDGFLSIWGHELETGGGGKTRRAESLQRVRPVTEPRGIPHAEGDPLPTYVSRELRAFATRRRWDGDLTLYGAVADRQP